MKIQGILFDKDGTLLDLEKTWIPPYRKAAEFIAGWVGDSGLAGRLLRAGGYDPDTRQWGPESVLASGSNDEVIKVWESQLGIHLSRERQEHIRETFFLSSVQHIPAIDNLSGLINQIQSRGLCLGLATMDDEASAKAMLEKFNMDQSFQFICGADSGFGVKPAPGMVHAFCHACALEQSEVMVVGDSPKDLHMARNAKAGMAVGVLSGAHAHDQLAADADMVLPSIADLPAALDSILLHA